MPPSFVPQDFEITNEAFAGRLFTSGLFSALEVRVGALAQSGSPRPWLNGPFASVARVCQTFTKEPGNGLEWYYPIRLDMDLFLALASLRPTHVTGYLRVQQGIDLMAPAYDRLVADPDAADAVLALAEELARAHLFANQSEVAQPYADRALQLAEASQDWERVVALLSRQSTIWLNKQMPIGAMALMRAAIDLGRQHHVPNALIIPLTNLSTFTKNHDLAASVEAGREAVLLAVQAGAHTLRSVTASNLSLPLWLTGAWDDIETQHRERTTVGQHFDNTITDALLWQLRVERGASIDELARPPRDISLVDDAGALPWVALQELQRVVSLGDDPAEVVRLAQYVVEAAVAVFDLDDDFPVIWPLVIDVLLAAGELAAAAPLIELVSSRPAGRITPLVHAHIPRLRGVLNANLGSVDEADDDLATAAEELRAFGAPFYLATTLYERARLLAGREDLGGVSGLLREARTIFEQLGAAPWIAPSTPSPRSELRVVGEGAANWEL